MRHRLQLISDIHSEHYANPLTFLAEKIDPCLHFHNPDFLILAGDIIGLNQQSYEQIDGVLGWFSRQARHVIYVTGNHEYWGGTQASAEFRLKGLLLHYPNIHWLDNSCVTLEGTRFVGGTMWFPELPDTKSRYEEPEEGMGPWSDFVEITDFRQDHWPYRKNKDFTSYVNLVVQPGDVVVTHYLPNHRSVNEEFRGTDTNRFFLSDQTKAIFEREPRYWFHGHTHVGADYKLDKTRVICNPYGYHHKHQPVYFPVIVEI